MTPHPHESVSPRLLSSTQCTLYSLLNLILRTPYSSLHSGVCVCTCRARAGAARVHDGELSGAVQVGALAVDRVAAHGLGLVGLARGRLCACARRVRQAARAARLVRRPPRFRQPHVPPLLRLERLRQPLPDRALLLPQCAPSSPPSCLLFPLPFSLVLFFSFSLAALTFSHSRILTLSISVNPLRFRNQIIFAGIAN